MLATRLCNRRGHVLCRRSLRSGSRLVEQLDGAATRRALSAGPSAASWAASVGRCSVNAAARGLAPTGRISTWIGGGRHRLPAHLRPQPCRVRRVARQELQPAISELVGTWSHVLDCRRGQRLGGGVQHAQLRLRRWARTWLRTRREELQRRAEDVDRGGRLHLHRRPVVGRRRGRDARAAQHPRHAARRARSGSLMALGERG